MDPTQSPVPPNIPEAAAAAATGAAPAATAPGAAPVMQFDVLHMFLQAHPVVQIVLIGLILTSVLTWSIGIDRWVVINRERRAAKGFERLFWSGKSLHDIERTVVSRRRPMAIGAIFLAALREWRLSSESGADLSRPSFRERVQAAMEVEAQKAIARLERGLLFLGTVGAAGPFIGLFGTVWGIMNAFTSIAAAQNATLAVVAPGIAEALSTTAIGLVAAIPAVILYNKFANDISGLGANLENFSRELWATISRELDMPSRNALELGAYEHGRDHQRVGQPAD
jgi:biopolymer transport protein TolQ